MWKVLAIYLCLSTLSSGVSTAGGVELTLPTEIAGNHSGIASRTTDCSFALIRSANERAFPKRKSTDLVGRVLGTYFDPGESRGDLEQPVRVVNTLLKGPVLQTKRLSGYTSVAISPDELRVAVARSQGTITIYNPVTGKPISSFFLPLDELPNDDMFGFLTSGTSVPHEQERRIFRRRSIFLKDNMTLLIVDVGGRLSYWDTSTGQEINSLHLPKGEEPIALSGDGTILMSRNYEKHIPSVGQEEDIKLWTLTPTGVKEQASFQLQISRRWKDYVRAEKGVSPSYVEAASISGNQFFVSAGGGELVIGQIENNAEVFSFDIQYTTNSLPRFLDDWRTADAPRAARFAAFIPNSEKIAWISYAGFYDSYEIVIFDFDKQEIVKGMSLSNSSLDPVLSFTVAPDGKYLYMGLASSTGHLITFETELMNRRSACATWLPIAVRDYLPKTSNNEANYFDPTWYDDKDGQSEVVWSSSGDLILVGTYKGNALLWYPKQLLR